MTPDQSPTGAVERLEAAFALLKGHNEDRVVRAAAVLETALSTLRQPTAAPEGWREALEKIIGLCSYKDNLSDARGIAEQALSSAPRPSPVYDGYRRALEEIAGSSIPDQPASASGDELSWAQRHVARLRGIAAKALSSAPPAPVGPTREEVEAVFAELSGRVGAPSWGYAIDKARDAILALFPTSEGKEVRS